MTELAVLGAHLSGQPLEHQLRDRGGVLVRAARTAARYRLYALDTAPPKPGLVRVEPGHPAAGAIEVEVWQLDDAGFGSFVALVPSPLCIGTLLLEDGTEVKGFLCEPIGAVGAEEITRFGGWRSYLADGGSSPARP